VSLIKKRNWWNLRYIRKKLLGQRWQYSLLITEAWNIIVGEGKDNNTLRQIMIRSKKRYGAEIDGLLSSEEICD